MSLNTIGCQILDANFCNCRKTIRYIIYTAMSVVKILITEYVYGQV